jgi:hypothetical protein
MAGPVGERMTALQNPKRSTRHWHRPAAARVIQNVPTLLRNRPRDLRAHRVTSGSCSER